MYSPVGEFCLESGFFRHSKIFHDGKERFIVPLEWMGKSAFEEKLRAKALSKIGIVGELAAGLSFAISLQYPNKSGVEHGFGCSAAISGYGIQAKSGKHIPIQGGNTAHP
jgi:hypothetical protein